MAQAAPRRRADTMVSRKMSAVATAASAPKIATTISAPRRPAASQPGSSRSGTA